MNGNPYYEANYEQYYHAPVLMDRVLDPEYWHGADQAARSVARRAGPALPIVAALAPLGVLGYVGRQEYNARRERKRIEREEAAERKRVADMMEELKTISMNMRTIEPPRGPSIPMDLEDNIADEPTVVVEESDDSGAAAPPTPRSVSKDPPRGRKPLRTPSRPPKIPSFNVDLPHPIRMLKGKSFVKGDLDKQAKVLMDAIEKYGYRDTIENPIIIKNYPELLRILEDPHAALTSGEPFPGPFHKLLTPETIDLYALRRSEGQQLGIAEKRRRKRQYTAAVKAEKKEIEAERKRIDENRRQADIQSILSPKPKSSKSGVVHTARTPRKKI